MTDPIAPVTITLRIPGKWARPQELLRNLPEGFRLTPELLVLPDQTEIEFAAVEADDEFAQIFRTSCRQPPTEEELATVDDHTVKVFLSGPGGSLPAAHTMMQAAAAIVHAGGAGVFIDNSALAHGGEQWLAMTDDGGPDALSFAFVGIVGGKTEVRTIGMHVLGLRDVVMKLADMEKNDFDIVEIIRYLCRGDKPVENGHIIADASGPRFQAFTEKGESEMEDSPMHNPYGRLKLVSLSDIAQSN